MSTISQREAHKLSKRVRELEDILNRQRHGWATEWPDGVNIASMDASNVANLCAVINTARILKHAVICTVDGNTVRFYGCPLPSR